MDTYKPFSTIGYNTELFLVERLNELKVAYPDLFWCYIYHDDEPNKKVHYHLYIEPNTRIREHDFMMIRESFKEYEEGSELPLACMPFRKSDFKNWYWYGIHDAAYLRTKRLQRATLNYPPESVKSSDESILQDYIAMLDPTEFESPIDKIIICYDNGMALHEAMSYLRIPYSAMYGFKNVWETYIKGKQKPTPKNLLEEFPPMPTDADAPPPYLDTLPDPDLSEYPW